MSKNVTVGIDVGSYLTKVVVVEHLKDRERKSSRIIGFGSQPSRGVYKGIVVKPDETAKVIRRAVQEAEKSSGIKIRQAIISVGGTSLESRISKGTAMITQADSKVTDYDVDRAVNASESNLKLKNQHIIERIPVSFKLDNRDILGRPENLVGTKLEVNTLFVTCLEHYLENLLTAVTDAGIDVIDAIPSPRAASFVTLSEKKKNAGCILLDFGSETVSATVFEDGEIATLKVVDMGGNDITNDLALGAQINPDEAEALKKGEIGTDLPMRKIEEIISARLEDMFDVIQKFLKKINRNERLPAGAILIGGTSKSSLIENIAKKVLKLPVTVFEPRNKKDILSDPSWYVAYGLCMSGKYTENNNYGNPFREIQQKIKSVIKNITKHILP